jgi:hypothetical protein
MLDPVSPKAFGSRQEDEFCISTNPAGGPVLGRKEVIG